MTFVRSCKAANLFSGIILSNGKYFVMLLVVRVGCCALDVSMDPLSGLVNACCWDTDMK